MEVQCYRTLERTAMSGSCVEDLATEVVKLQNVVHVPTAAQLEGVDVGSMPERGPRECRVTAVKVRASKFTEDTLH